MSEEEVLCAAFDNTTMKNDEASLENCNPTYVSDKLAYVEEQTSVKTDEPRACTEEVKSMSGSYSAICSDYDPLEMDPKNSISENINSESLSNELTHSVEKDTRTDSTKHSYSLPDNPISGDSHSRENSDPDDCNEDVMTGSYGEISLEQEILNCDKNSSSLSSREENSLNECRTDIMENRRPSSLVLTENNTIKLEEVPVLRQESSSIQHVHRSQQTSGGRTVSAEASPSLSSEEFAIHSSSRHRTGSDTSGLSELHGTLTVDGDLVTFVAEDLHEKIKMSSPVSRWTDTSFPSSRSSTPSLYRQALQPNIPIVDPNVITDLEQHAKKVATCVDTMLENLSETLQCVSSLTVDCMGTYEKSVCKTCDAVDVNIKSVYQLMAKCEELSTAMEPLYKMSGDIKHIKKMLDQLEHIVEHKS